MRKSSSQNQTGRMSANLISYVPLNPSLSPKAILSQVHVSLANASATAQKSVGTNAHSISVRLAAANGHLAYAVSVYDMNTAPWSTCRSWKQKVDSLYSNSDDGPKYDWKWK